MRIISPLDRMPMKQAPLLPLMFLIAFSSRAQNWTPDAALISKVEAGIKSDGISPRYPEGHPLAIDKYARYYLGYTANSHRMIRGRFIIPFGTKMKPAGVYFVGSQKEFPVVFDGGCSVMNLVYDVEAEHVISLRCNGFA